MKKLVLCLALVLCGCTPNGLEQSKKPKKPRVELRFQIGDMVDLKIGGTGQIVNIVGKYNRPYSVRIRTDAGIERVWFDEFELEIK